MTIDIGKSNGKWYQNVDFEELPQQLTIEMADTLAQPNLAFSNGVQNVEELDREILTNVHYIGSLIEEVYRGQMELSEEQEDRLALVIFSIFPLIEEIHELLKTVDVPVDSLIKKLYEQGTKIFMETEPDMPFREELKSIFYKMKSLATGSKDLYEIEPLLRNAYQEIYREHDVIKNELYRQGQIDNPDAAHIEVKDYQVNMIMLETTLSELLESLDGDDVEDEAILCTFYKYVILVFTLLYNAISGQSGIYFEYMADEGELIDFLGETRKEKIKNLTLLLIQTLQGIKKVRELREIMTGKRNEI
ncbi:hypothetical protein ACFL21_04105 [Patescibacteria group bacterium]